MHDACALSTSTSVCVNGNGANNLTAQLGAWTLGWQGPQTTLSGATTILTGIDQVAQEVSVRTDEEEEISYDFAELDELAHAYAITVHRSQGSEYPAVVVPVTTSAWMMLQRNLLYTAITRAKKLVVLVGSRRALAQAVRNASSGRRHTALAHRLRHPSTDSRTGYRPENGGPPA